MDFCMTESCGKCVPCRVGTYQMHRILSAITGMRATPQDLTCWKNLCDLVKHTSLCGLGQSAPNPGGEHFEIFRCRVQGAYR